MARLDEKLSITKAELIRSLRNSGLSFPDNAVLTVESYSTIVDIDNDKGLQITWSTMLEIE